MKIDLATLEAMAAGGATIESVIAVLKAQVSSGEERRRKDRERKRRVRNSADICGNARNSADTADNPQQVETPVAAEPPPVVLEASDKNRTHLLTSFLSLEDSLGTRGSEDTRARECILRAEHETWYGGYPHKVGKRDSLRAFLKARKKASLEILIEGRDRYVRDKPPNREWCNPATWLNGERWNDEPAPQMARAPPLQRSMDFSSMARELHEAEKVNGHYR